MRALAGLLRLQPEGASAAAARAYGSVVASSGPPFLRYANPVPAAIDHTPLLATLPETQVTTLPNGLRVATETIPHAETTTVGVYVNAGSRFETDATNGVANFLEHVLFKGTKKTSGKDLEAAVAGMGAQLSAFTGREQTSYVANVVGKDVGKAVDILADCLLNPVFADEAVEAARSTILGQLGVMNKPSAELVFDHLHATAFQHSPLGRTVMGSANSVSAITKDHLAAFMKQNYVGPRVVLAAAGAVSHDELVKKASEAFGGMADEDPSSSLRGLLAKEPSLYTGSYVHDRFPFAKELGMAVAFKAAAANDADAVPLMVMQTMLGGYSSSSSNGINAGSQLTQAVAMEGLAQSYTAFSKNYHDTGLFGIYGVTSADRCEDFAFTAMQEMTKMCYSVVESDVMRAKTQLKASLLMVQDSTHHVAESIGRDLLVHGRRMPKAEMLARIDAVNADTVRDVADKYIYDKCMVVAAAGDAQFLPDYNWFRRRSYWLRY
jgi:processing peptidase subunit beta